jgi:hypothetical protein
MTNPNAASGLSPREIEEEIRRFKAEKRKSCTGIISLYSQAWREFWSKHRQYSCMRKDACKSYDEIIGSLKNGLRAAKAMDPKYRLKRNVMIGLACVACLYTGTYLGDKPSPVASPKPANAASQISCKPDVKKAGSTSHRPTPQQYNSAEHWYFPNQTEALTSIAKAVSGDSSNWKSIRSYNSLPGSLTHVNKPLRIPGWMAANKKILYSGSLDCRLYEVGTNDTWPGLSQKVYGIYNREHELKAFNRKYNPRFSDALMNNRYILLPK